MTDIGDQAFRLGFQGDNTDFLNDLIQSAGLDWSGFGIEFINIGTGFMMRAGNQKSKQ
ncbi:MAG: hypothetical protein WC865_11865 [Bacteroidales bacterium]